jgi:hypothetical protein
MTSVTQKSSGATVVAGTPAIAALRASYAVRFSRVEQQLINLPPSRQTACCGKSDMIARKKDGTRELGNNQPARITQNF